MSRYLVTGGCGFIGSHLVDSLMSDGHEIVVLDNLSSGQVENLTSKIDLVVGDISDEHLVNNCMKDVEGCFHLAAISSIQKSNEDWLGTHAVNLGGSINVFNAARNHKIPVIYASSAAVYGNNIDTPLTEASIARPITAYGADKLSSEFHARVASEIPTLGLRLFNVYGPRQDPKSPYSGVISIFSERISRGEKITIYGDGQQSRDFVFVSDAVNFFRKGMENIQFMPATMNVCTGRSTSILELAQTIMHLSDKLSDIDYMPPQKGDIYTSIGDPGLAQRCLALKVKYSLYEGIAELLPSIPLYKLASSH